MGSAKYVFWLGLYLRYTHKVRAVLGGYQFQIWTYLGINDEAGVEEMRVGVAQRFESLYILSIDLAVNIFGVILVVITVIDITFSFLPNILLGFFDGDGILFELAPVGHPTFLAVIARPFTVALVTVSIDKADNRSDGNASRKIRGKWTFCLRRWHSVQAERPLASLPPMRGAFSLSESLRSGMLRSRIKARSFRYSKFKEE